CPFVALVPLFLWPFLRNLMRALAWGTLAGGLISFVMGIALSDGLWFFGAMALLPMSLVCWIIVWVQRAMRGRSWGTGAAASASTWSDSSSSWSSSSSDSSWSSSDSGSSSSDFSGGGGDSGGGGSSDSW
ncbi:MAG TPA: hypothetical protein VFV24_03025, partial [Candidatus Eisenbacteria bacterium]|nr:hypothetical protein [Candidatus Eisenbacteria bacterium]